MKRLHRDPYVEECLEERHELRLRVPGQEPFDDHADERFPALDGGQEAFVFHEVREGLIDVDF